jgi:phosphatidylserine/phosphatidylglycerophosphate/cardiolipin synthase-like enzyme
MPTFADGKIEAFVGPKDLKAPDNLEAEIVGFIAGAKASLDIAVQELDSEPIAQAVLDARARGVDVTMVLEQDYLREKAFPKKPSKAAAGETAEEALRRWQWSSNDGEHAENRRLLSALLHSAIDVKADFNRDIFHQKFVLRDYRLSKRDGNLTEGRGVKASAALLTGSANFTHTDCHTNLNHVFVFHDKRVCRQYRDEFDEIAKGEFGRRQHGDVPRAYNVGGVPVKVLFAPDHTPELELIKQILKAEKEVEFAIFTFAGSSGIDDALLMAAKAGCEVTGALDPGQASQRWSAPQGTGGAPSWLNRKNISLFTPKREGGFRKLHHKLMAIDRHTVVAGSFNYTAPANEYNDENLFVIGSPHDLPRGEGGPVDKTACRQIVDYMRKEINRIVSVSDRWKP